MHHRTCFQAAASRPKYPLSGTETCCPLFLVVPHVHHDLQTRRTRWPIEVVNASSNRSLLRLGHCLLWHVLTHQPQLTTPVCLFREPPPFSQNGYIVDPKFVLFVEIPINFVTALVTSPPFF